ncbi:TIGR00730 family Rossman fold protein [Anaeromyxobacter sp. Red801]|uniref:LOG family protein n=1 Tax=Anaeromyxobacter sp. Red801 TaxID=3411632 RepID=UPI003BA384C3
MRICIFCGSSSGVRPEYAAAARETGDLLARRGIGMVFGGGRVGLMGLAADAALAAGGEVVGVIPRTLVEREVAHQRLTAQHVVETMHERKALMAKLTDAFVALPGGAGTYEELFEIWTWAQLGIHRKPLGVLDVSGYFAPLLAMADHAVKEGFMRPEYRAMLQVARDPAELLDRLAAYRPPEHKWAPARDVKP